MLKHTVSNIYLTTRSYSRYTIKTHTSENNERKIEGNTKIGKWGSKRIAANILRPTSNLWFEK